MAYNPGRSDPPASVMVCGYQIAIRVCPRRDIDGNLGTINVGGQLIRLLDDQGPDSMADTVLHEILHMIDKSTAAHQDELTESQTQRLATMLRATLIDPRNRALLCYLFTHQEQMPMAEDPQ